MKRRNGGAACPKRRKSLFKTEKDALALKTALQSTRGLTKAQALELLGVHQPSCCVPGKKELTKSSPTCLCGLIPADGQCRKKGLWAKPNEGQDPARKRKREAGELAGIRNLGYTCYMSSALQLLNSVPEVKETLLDRDPEGGTEKEKVAARLIQQLFGDLEYSSLAVAEVDELAKILGLDFKSQQDPQEFLKLFQSFLDRLYRRKDERGEGIFERCLAGSASNVTKCRECGGMSPASNLEESFLDLQLQVGNKTTLEEMLDSYLAPSLLTGDNKYACDNCGFQTDAERYVMLRKLPPRLQLTLSRFDYDPRICGRRKINNFVEIPLDIDIADCLKDMRGHKFLADEAGKKTKYTLSCIVHHMGDKATSGHCVAQVRMPDGKWWVANDECATMTGDMPLGDPLTGEGSIANVPISTRGRRIVSKSAYMCVYTQVDEWLSQSQSSQSSSTDSLSQVHKRIKERTMEKFRAQTSAWDKLVASVEDRRSFVRECLEKCRMKTLAEDDQWIDADWLESFMDDETEPMTIDTSAVSCSHQKLDPRKICRAKQISAEGFQMLKSRYKDGQVLTSSDLCTKCLLPMCEDYLEAARESAKRAHILEALEEPMEVEKRGHWISKTWLQSWKKRPDATAARSPTAGIVCCHNKLAPHRLARRISVPEVVWNYFKESHFKHKNSLQGDEELADFKAFRVRDCPHCSIVASEEEFQQQSLRQLIKTVQADIPRLASGAKLELQPDTTYYLWPTKWVASWRKWLHSKGRVSATDTPTMVDALKANVCSCHLDKPGTTFQPPKICIDRGKFLLDPVHAQDWEVLTETEWFTLLSYHNGGDQYIDNAVRCWIDLPEDNHHRKKSRLSNGGSSREEPVLVTDPVECEEYIEKHPYIPDPFHNERFDVTLSLYEDATRQTIIDRSSRKRRKICVSSTDTLKRLKINVFEAMAVPPPNQRVFWDSVEKQDESATLGSLGLRVGTLISIVNAHLVDDNDLSWIEEAQTRDTNSPQRETGFANTMLMGGFP